MTYLTRQEFLDICTNAITQTRQNISITNQLSGYIKYHREMTLNDYLNKNVRRLSKNNYMYQHALIAHTGVGNCSEIAEYLAVEIAQTIRKKGARARINIVSSKIADHGYLEIIIPLAKEYGNSRWEVDAWDPRIIDISTQPDGTIKNREALTYGYNVNLITSIHTNDSRLDRDKSTYKPSLSSIRKPEPGTVSEEEGGTPLSRMLDKHHSLYFDYSIEEAQTNKMLPKDGNIHYVHQMSFWQEFHHKRRRTDEPLQQSRRDYPQFK